MSGSRLRTRIPVVVLAGLFFFGLLRLFVLRFEAGDVYPAYSSLRSDPLGIQVLYESVRVLRPEGIQRSYAPLERIAFSDGRAVLICGVRGDTRSMQSAGWERMLAALSAGGGRLIVTFTGSGARVSSRDGDDGTDEPCGEDAGENLQEDQPDGNGDGAFSDRLNVTADLGISLEAIEPDDDNRFAVKSGEPLLPSLPDTITWYGSRGFVLEDPQWRTIYHYQNAPVIVSRPWGKGRVVMAADSYLFSNEALRNDRMSGLLAWLVMAEPNLLVDEAHHGLLKQPGVAALARKYRLHGVVAVLALLTVLFIWQRTAVFVPPERASPADPDMRHVTGRDTADGLVLLMRQHIPPTSLPAVCFEAWRSSPAAVHCPDEVIAAVRECAVDPGPDGMTDNPVSRYRQICELLKKGKRR